MRLALVVAAFVLMAAGGRPPVTIFVGAPHGDSRLYGPADMLCDLNKCRLFNLPETAGLAPGTIVEFGIPEMGGQDRAAAPSNSAGPASWAIRQNAPRRRGTATPLYSSRPSNCGSNRRAATG